MLVVFELHDVTLHLSGAFTEANVGAFAACVRAALAEQPRRLVVDMSALDLVDAAAGLALGDARDDAASHGVEFILDSPTATVRTAFAAGFRIR